MRPFSSAPKGFAASVNISFQVVKKLINTITIEYSGDLDFTWEGTVDLSGKVEEIGMSPKPEPLSAEDALDTAVAFIIENEEAIMDL